MLEGRRAEGRGTLRLKHMRILERGAAERAGRTRHGASELGSAHRAISELIVAGQLRPGEPVRVERLAAWLGLAPAPVREALARLVDEGLIVELPGGEARVVELDERYVREVFLVRSGLEGLCVELATPRIAPDDLAGLVAMLERTGAALARGDPEAYGRADAALHRLVTAAADNRILLAELCALQPHVDLIRTYTQRGQGTHLPASHGEHLAIVAALQRRDAAAARQCMERHIRAAGERTLRLLARTAGPAAWRRATL